MILGDYTSTQEYRDGLAKALGVARGRLSRSDFRAFSRGVGQEIARLDEELSQYYSVLFPSASSPNGWTLLPAKEIPTGMQVFSVRFNSPSQSFVPWLAHTDANCSAFAVAVL
jgi:hypothetical protein